MPIPKKPKAADYMTDDGMHTAMRQWANAQSKPSRVCEVLYSDGNEVFRTVFTRATREVEYKLRDGEVYTVDVDTTKFDAFFADDPLSGKELRARFNEWVKPDLPRVVIRYVKWTWEV